jgi:sulfite exporter TauE/SafE
MVDATLFAAFLVGLTGFVHCAAMCGGIVSVITTKSASTGSTPWAHLLLYNTGRILSYSLAGFVAGALGQWLLAWLPASQALVAAKIIIGLFLIALGLHITGYLPVLSVLEKAGSLFWRLIEPFGRRFIPVKHWHQALFIGMLWGWLPCGLVYAVLVWAMASASALQGALLMASFGLGTLPALIVLGATSHSLSRLNKKPWLRVIAGTLVILLGVWYLLSLFSAGGVQHSHH